MAKWHGIRQYRSCCTSRSLLVVRYSPQPFARVFLFHLQIIDLIFEISFTLLAFPLVSLSLPQFALVISVALNFSTHFCVYQRAHSDSKLNFILGFRNWKINFPTRTWKLKCTHLCDDDKIMWARVRVRVRTYLLLTWQKQHLTNSCHPMALYIKVIILAQEPNNFATFTRHSQHKHT